MVFFDNEIMWSVMIMMNFQYIWSRACDATQMLLTIFDSDHSYIIYTFIYDGACDWVCVRVSVLLVYAF